MPILVVIGLVVIGLFLLASRTGGSKKVDPIRELHRITHDPKTAERLIEAERKREPGLNDRTYARRAVRRLRRDRGR